MLLWCYSTCSYENSKFTSYLCTSELRQQIRYHPPDRLRCSTNLSPLALIHQWKYLHKLVRMPSQQFLLDDLLLALVFRVGPSRIQ